MNWNTQSYRYDYRYRSYYSQLESGLEKNYCRRPDDMSRGPWCYISRGRYARWEYCDIPKCEKKESTCTDDHEHCADWAFSDFCTHSAYQEFMRSTCRKSCNLCGEGATEEIEATEEATEEECSDNQGDCEFWAKQGYCTPGSLYSDYMGLYCRKSCGKCGGEGEKYETKEYTEWWDRKTEEQQEKTEAPKTEKKKEEKVTAAPEECPAGLTLCPDGKCRHVHMCKKS